MAMTRHDFGGRFDVRFGSAAALHCILAGAPPTINISSSDAGMPPLSKRFFLSSSHSWHFACTAA